MLLSILALGCARAAPGGPRPVPQTIARPLEVYRELGFLAGPAEFPAVARFATLAGPADSSYVLFGLSLPNSALRFTRENTGFSASYTVVINFMRDSAVLKRVDRRETVRVGTFAETGRTDESIIFQDVVTLPPGRYMVSLAANDGSSSRGFRTRDTLVVPDYRNRAVSPPLLVFAARARTDQSVRPDLIINPRNTVPYGAETPKVYFELYSAELPGPVEVRVLDEQRQPVWRQQTTFSAGPAQVRAATLEIPTAALPLGRLWLEASAGPADTTRTPLLVTISDQWVVANFDEVLRFVSYIATTAELDSLRGATGAERRDRWEQFWARRDPLAATRLNEFREDFFQRVRFATEHFGEAGRPGWDSDRGEVYIVLGPPDDVVERQIGRDAAPAPNAIEWHYESTPGGRLQLLFIDRAGFGRYELSPQSENAFRVAASRLKPVAPR